MNNQLDENVSSSSPVAVTVSADRNNLYLPPRLAGNRLFSRRFTSTSRFVVSSQVWMHTIPTRNCDVLVTFSGQTDDDTLMWLLSRLRQRAPELAVHVRHHSHTDMYGFYLTATYENLLKEAESLAIRKPIKKEYGGGMKDFVFEDREYFDGIEDSSAFFSSQERQNIVRHMLFNLRALDGDILNRIKFLEEESIVPVLLSKGVIKQILPLHNSQQLDFLRKHWVQAICQYQPIDTICEYFGVKLAMYFAYLGHYTKALTIPAFIGMAMWLISGQNQTTDDICFVLFAFINVLWATLYLEHWKRESAQYAYRWGTLDKEDELLVEPRPFFHGNLVKSPITGRLEPHYPTWKRNLFRYIVSVPVICACLSVVFYTMWWIFQLQDWVNEKIEKGEAPFFCKLLPKILLAVCIGFMDDVYKKIAFWLNNKENYRLDEAYENHLIIKLVLFQFVNSFLSLFYIAFYLQDMRRLTEQLAALLITRQVIGNIKEALIPYIVEKVKLFKIGYNMTEGMSPATLEKHMKEIKKQNKGSIWTNDNQDSETVVENHENTSNQSEPDNQNQSPVEENSEEQEDVSEEVSGVVTEQATDETSSSSSDQEYASCDELEITNSGPHLTQAEVEATMKKYEDTFEDYLEMLVQFGYVTLFSSAFPMAAMCALLNNIIEIRSDAFKLCMIFQRPFGQRVENIGTWQDCLEVMSVIAVMINCALIGMSGLANRFFPDLSTVERFVFIVVLEHAVLILKFLVAYAIPDIPDWVAEEKARLEYLRREALKKLESGSPTSTLSSPGSPNVRTADSCRSSTVNPHSPTGSTASRLLADSCHPVSPNAIVSTATTPTTPVVCQPATVIRRQNASSSNQPVVVSKRVVRPPTIPGSRNPARPKVVAQPHGRPVNNSSKETKIE